ncbi:MAG: F0F1 ATP synthase subunit gamma [Alphaproteobacteria bacterium]|nr:F0F1 ATP synthase subunit gamma [Alphaproteobacteria bacterium]
MPEAPHDLARVEQKIAAVGAVHQVMRAVWALARAQQPQVEAAAAEATAYLDVAEQIVERLAGRPATADVPSDHVLWVLVGPERPFCGPLARMLIEQLPETGPVGLVGHRLHEVAAQDAALDARVAFRVPAASTPDELGHRAEQLATAILAAEQRTVVVLHPERGGPELHRTVLLAGSREPAEDPPETFLPPAEVLAAAVLEAVAGRLAVALVEALRAEVRARLVAAEAARTSCDRRIADLSQHWRALRQGQITEELIELTAGRIR